MMKPIQLYTTENIKSVACMQHNGQIPNPVLLCKDMNSLYAAVTVPEQDSNQLLTYSNGCMWQKET